MDQDLSSSESWSLNVVLQDLPKNVFYRNHYLFFYATNVLELFQLQGVKWIKQKYGENLQVIRLGQKGYLETIEKAIIKGKTVLLENIGETVDPVLDPLLGRNLIKKGM